MGAVKVMQEPKWPAKVECLEAVGVVPLSLQLVERIVGFVVGAPRFPGRVAVEADLYVRTIESK